jgi:hypothetical protein
MAAIVSLRDVIDEMEMMSDEATSHINRKTGELITITKEMFNLADDPDEAGTCRMAERALPKVREVTASEDLIPLPSKFDIHEWSIMERFARSVIDEDVRDELKAALHGRGAFGRFTDALHRRGIADAWYRYRDAALEEIAVEFLETNGITYQRGQNNN